MALKTAKTMRKGMPEEISGQYAWNPLYRGTNSVIMKCLQIWSEFINLTQFIRSACLCTTSCMANVRTDTRILVDILKANHGRMQVSIHSFVL